MDKKRGWDLAAALARSGDRILNVVIVLMLVTALLYGGFGLWDTWNIYRKAGVSDELLTYKPVATGENTTNDSLEELEKINPDVCGWITIEDTNIDYPVVQGESNWTYLNQAVDGSFSLAGSIFMDYRNAKDFSDPVSLIYGHHMDGGAMFGGLPKFLKEEYFQNHTTGTLFTPEHTYSIQWFACVETNAYEDRVYNLQKLANRESVEELLQYIQETATVYQDVGETEDQQLIILSTCTSDNTDDRIILIGRLS
jgi:sortase B